MKSKEIMIDKICNLIILNVLSKTDVNTSYMFRNIFLNTLGIINDEHFLIKEMTEQGLITHEGVYENSTFYKSLKITDNGKKYFDDNIDTIVIPNKEFSNEKLLRIKNYLRR